MPYPTTLEVIGGSGGGSFSFTGKENGASLEKIWVWVGEWQVKAVKVWLSDGRSRTFGEPSGSHQEYVFQPGECFTSLSLWQLERFGFIKNETRLAAIKFKTNKGGEFLAEWFLKEQFFVTSTTEHPVDVGSGYCLGVEGRSGADIDSMGFMFLNAVQSVVLTNVSYPTIKHLILKVAVQELKSMTYRNETSVNQEHKIETSMKVIKQSSWSLSTSITATFSVEVKAGIPKIADVFFPGFSVSVGAESTYSQQQTEERTETMTSTLVVPPKKKVVVDITIGRATFDLPYTGTVKITCKNGSVLEYETKGQYKGVTYTDIKVKTKESDL